MRRARENIELAAEWESERRVRSEEEARRMAEAARLEAEAEARREADAAAEALNERIPDLGERRYPGARRPPSVGFRRLFFSAVFATLLAAVALYQMVPHGPRITITSPRSGDMVTQDQIVRGTGWNRTLNSYLVVEPRDGSGRKFIQGRIGSQVWSLRAYFGDRNTPSGMRFYVYVLSTSTELPVGEFQTVPQRSSETPRITVILK